MRVAFLGEGGDPYVVAELDSRLRGDDHTAKEAGYIPASCLSIQLFRTELTGSVNYPHNNLCYQEGVRHGNGPIAIDVRCQALGRRQCRDTNY